ncbi:hypothetical protein ACIXT3_00815 [Bacteroides fragilis]
MKNIHSVLDSQETEAWQKLIRVLTHEIMNSITPVTSLSELLEHQIEDFDGNEEERAEIRRMLQTIRRRGDGLIRFVNSYREVSHLPQPLLKIYTSQELLTGVVRLMYREPNDLHLILPPKGQRLMADKDLIEQVLINLIKKRPRERCDRHPDLSRIKFRRTPLYKDRRQRDRNRARGARPHLYPVLHD